MERCTDSFSEFKPILEEAKGNVAGKGILGKLKGTFFVLDGESRNKRFYSKSLWEKVVHDPTVHEKLEKRRMFGTISHEQPINDEALLGGKLSHIVTSLYIDDKKGIGEAIILDTEAGRILNSCLRANAGIYVSSRARGELIGNTENGIPKVNPDNYQLETFDIVLDPGFLAANPTISESLKKLSGKEEFIKETTKEQTPLVDIKPIVRKESNMSESSTTEKVLEKSYLRSSELEAKLAQTQKENKGLTEKNDILVRENKELRENDTEHCDSIKDYKDESDLLFESFATRDVQELAESFGEIKSILERIKTVSGQNDIDGIIEALKEAKKLKSEFGSVYELAEVVEAINLHLDTFEETFGGNMKTASKVIDKAIRHIDEQQDYINAGRANSLSKKLGVDADVVEELISKGVPLATISSLVTEAEDNGKKDGEKDSYSSKFKDKDDDDKEDDDGDTTIEIDAKRKRKNKREAFNGWDIHDTPASILHESLTGSKLTN